PISPYDPAWSERATVKAAGTSLLYLPDETIARATGGAVADLAQPRYGDMQLWQVEEDGASFEAGQAMSHEDASGLTALMDKMSQREYDQVREWVIDGGRDPRTGRIDRNRFMSQRAVRRSAAVLDELKREGVSYEVMRGRRPRQIQTKIAGMAMEIRPTDQIHEDYGGARIHHDGRHRRHMTCH